MSRPSLIARPTDAWSGGATTPATSAGDGSAVPFEAELRSRWCPTLPRLVGRDLVRRRCGGDRGSSPRRTTSRSWRSRHRLPGPSARARTPMGVGRLDPQGTRRHLRRDGRLVSLRHTENGDILHHALMVLDAADGDWSRTLVDAGSNLDPTAWSPRPGTIGCCFTSGARGVRATGDLDAEVRRATRSDRRSPGRRDPGGVVARRLLRSWYVTSSRARSSSPGGSRHRRDRRSSPTRTARSPTAAVRPDGQVWFQTSDSVSRPRVVNADGDGRPDARRRPAAERPAYRSFWFDNPAGQRVQAFVVTPPGDGPHPTGDERARRTGVA